MNKEWKPQLKDKKGVYSSYGVYMEVYDDIKSDLEKLNNNKRRIITHRAFSSVMRLYFKLVVRNVLNGYSFTLNNRFGKIRIAKRKMNRYVPKLMDIKKDENGKVVIGFKNEIEVANKYNWFWHYLDWSTFKRYRTHEIKPSVFLKREMMGKVDRGFEYIDYTPLNSREAGSINKIK